MFFYENFRKIGQNNSEIIIDKIVDFIRFHHIDVKNGNKVAKAVVGVSGGVDSALTATLARRALGAKNVIAVKPKF